jgi:GMP synthase (glutamine-hydrolysing)
MQLLVLDPALERRETACANLIASLVPWPVSYHAPAIAGFGSLDLLDWDQLAGVVVLGSMAGVNDRYDWQPELERRLHKTMLRKIPLLAICYGHQLLGAMFGSKIETAPKKRLGMRKVQFTGTGAVSGIPQSETFFVSHNDHVVDVPAGLRLFATSPEVAVDGLVHPDLPVWSLQSHPESTESFCRDCTYDLPASEVPVLQGGHQFLTAIFTEWQKIAKKP